MVVVKREGGGNVEGGGDSSEARGGWQSGR